jgi:hypothetical protein
MKFFDKTPIFYESCILGTRDADAGVQKTIVDTESSYLQSLCNNGEGCCSAEPLSGGKRNSLRRRRRVLRKKNKGRTRTKGRRRRKTNRRAKSRAKSRARGRRRRKTKGHDKGKVKGTK